ncbi:hypothetical protein TWF694_008400 [Orbilia ellipsospora]|uniref:protein-histidine N-methyltransferase n=1 Tax=Orbilia ellipsospora TaxID=2528407 RepID=A0AAV9XGX6_9PEZI
MAFKFNFDLPADEEEDIRIGNEDRMDVSAGAGDEASSNQSRIPAQSHTLNEMISKLPPHIAYSTLTIPISSSKIINIPRRELFDVKMQLMTEDTMSTDQQKFSAAFTDEDIRTNTYEGGLKSWECSSDLVKQLAQDITAWGNSPRILELGCGTALPSCFILQSLLSSPDTPPHPVHLTVADYNIDVLRLVTLPNLILAYLQNTPHLSRQSNMEGENENENEADGEPREIELSPEILASFLSTLSSKKITISFLSGSWSPAMISLIHGVEYPSTNKEKMCNLILASETIYSPESIPLFVDMIEYTLKEGTGRGYIAAKDIYFGVGGSVKDFVAFVEGKGWRWEVVREEKRGVGVSRVVGVVCK